MPKGKTAKATSVKKDKETPKEAPSKRKKAQLDDSNSKKAKTLLTKSASNADSKLNRSDNVSVKLSKEEAFFENYKDETGQMIDPFGIEKLFTDIGISPESFEALCLCYKLKAQKMGYFTQEEFIEGMKALKCSTAQELKKVLDKCQKEFDAPLNFKSMYEYAFKFCHGEKPEARTIEIDTAKDMLRCVMLKRYPITEKFVAFLEQSNYKAMSQDVWMMFLEFAKKVKPDLSNISDAGDFWPTTIDEFVEWVQKGFKPKIANNQD